MSYIEAIILGIVQGLTEFLPVSSSGHLLMLQHFFGINADSVLIFTLLLHVGTLISVFFCYWSDIWELIKELFLTIADLVRGKGLRLNERPVRKLGVMIIIASIPTAIIGVLFKDIFEGFYETLLPTGIGLIITGIFLWIAEIKRDKHAVGIEGMKARDAIAIGVMQGIAICPGISRSGSTLFGGLSTGLKRDFAVKFAFLISIPSILGSLIFEGGSDAMASAVDISMGPVIAGCIAAALSGVLAIRTMIAVVRKLSLRYFSFYVWIVGSALIIYTLITH